MSQNKDLQKRLDEKTTELDEKTQTVRKLRNIQSNMAECQAVALANMSALVPAAVRAFSSNSRYAALELEDRPAARTVTRRGQIQDRSGQAGSGSSNGPLPDAAFKLEEEEY